MHQLIRSWIAAKDYASLGERKGEFFLTTSGSQKRKRSHPAKTTLDDTEHALFLARCEKAGVSQSSFLRCIALDIPFTAATRQPSTDRTAVSELIGQLGQLYQSIEDYKPKATNEELSLLDTMARDLSDICALANRALGRRG